MSVTVKGGFLQLGPAIRARLSAAVRQSAFDLEREVKANITAQNLVDTGFMRNSVTSVVTSQTSAVVTVVADYAVFHEYGAPGANLPARPFFTPAVVTIRPVFVNRCVEAVRG